MKDYKKILGHILKKWRKQQGITLYQIAKDESVNVRIETLQRIEKGEEVRTDGLLKYLHYCYARGYDVMQDVWNYNNSCVSADKESISELLGENENVTNSTIEHTTTDLAVIKTEQQNAADLTEDNITDVTPNSPAENIPDPVLLTVEEKFSEGKFLGESDQMVLIRNGRCPKCGSINSFTSRVSKKGNNYETCATRGCDYMFFGSVAEPSIEKSRKEGILPLRGAK